MNINMNNTINFFFNFSFSSSLFCLFDVWLSTLYLMLDFDFGNFDSVIEKELY